MAWLDAPCTAAEVNEWHCQDVWTEHPAWPFACSSRRADEPPDCLGYFTLRRIAVRASAMSTLARVALAAFTLLAGGGLVRWLMLRRHLSHRATHMDAVDDEEAIQLGAVRGKGSVARPKRSARGSVMPDASGASGGRKPRGMRDGEREKQECPPVVKKTRSGGDYSKVASSARAASAPKRTIKAGTGRRAVGGGG
jgi:hypothetical protein